MNAFPSLYSSYTESSVQLLRLLDLFYKSRPGHSESCKEGSDLPLSCEVALTKSFFECILNSVYIY